MRPDRQKPVDADPCRGTYYHLYNRSAGLPGEFFFGDPEKEMFLRIMKKLGTLYTLDILAWQVMGNHFHIVVFAPEQPPTPEEAARRYRIYHNDKKKLDPDTPECQFLAEKLRDFSYFMHGLQHQFSTWYNRTKNRRGALWAGRFKSTILEGETALWNGIMYTELNAVRAKIVADPADYRFGSWGEWNGAGTHPYADALLGHLRHTQGGHTANWSLSNFQQELRAELARIHAAEQVNATSATIEAAITEAVTPASLTALDRRVRYWSDGLAIGSKLFLEKVMSDLLPTQKVENHRTSPQFQTANVTIPPICAWRRLRAVH